MTSENIKPSRHWLWNTGALLAALLAVAVRCIPWNSIFSDGLIVLPDNDPYYHLRRVQLLIEQFPSIPTFDPFLSFPHGASIPWPPGFDWLISLPGLFGATSYGIATWGAILMPVLGGVAVYLVYRLGRQVFDPATGLVAAVLMALMKGAMDCSSLGRIDHHGLVAPVTLGMFLAFCAALRTKEIKWGVLCGLLASVAVLSFSISPPIYFFPVPATLFLIRWMPGSEKVRKVAWACLGSAGVFCLGAVLIGADLARSPWSLYQASLFTVVVFALWGFLVLPFYTSRKIFFGVMIVGLAAGCFLLCLVPGLRASVLDAFRVAGRDDPSYLMAGESASIFFEGGMFSLGRAVAHYTTLIVLAPVLWLALVWRMTRQKDFQPGKVFLAVFSLVAIGLLCIQDRFGEYSAPALALLFAWSLTGLIRFCLDYVRASQSKPRAAVLGVLLVGALGLALAPLATSLEYITRTDTVRQQRELLKFGKSLSEILPPLQEHQGEFSYGVLAGWGESHQLLTLTRRPMVVSPFGTQDAYRNNQIGFRLLLAANEETVFSQMSQLRIRFVVVAPIVAQVNAMAKLAGLSERFMIVSQGVHHDHYFSHYQPLRPFSECVHTRLFLADGSIREVEGVRQGPLSHFRLKLESSSTLPLFGQAQPLFKAFEVVKGARIRGTADPASLVRFRIPLRTNTGREFMYQNEATTQADGQFEIIVPYPTGNSDARVSAVSAGQLKLGERVVDVNISEEDVVEGLVVKVP